MTSRLLPKCAREIAPTTSRSNLSTSATSSPSSTSSPRSRQGCDFSALRVPTSLARNRQEHQVRGAVSEKTDDVAYPCLGQKALKLGRLPIGDKLEEYLIKPLTNELFTGPLKSSCACELNLWTNG